MASDLKKTLEENIRHFDLSCSTFMFEENPLMKNCGIPLERGKKLDLRSTKQLMKYIFEWKLPKFQLKYVFFLFSFNFFSLVVRSCRFKG